MQPITFRCAVTWLLLCAPLWAQSAEPEAGDANPSAGGSAHYFLATAWPVASDAQLDNLRGGFEVSSNLAVSFGFLRSVTINGDLVSETRFHLPDLANITAEQAKLLGDALSAAQIIQNGSGNFVLAKSSFAGVTGATVVQNSLNNQSIQTLTVIDASTNSLGLLHSINSQGVLRDALAGAIGMR